MLYQSLLDIEKIEKVYKDVRKSTKHKDKIINFETYYMTNVMNIYEILKSKSYKHQKYNIFLYKEKKYRLIMSECITDKIINHLISEEILLPLIEPKLIDTNVATRRGKGTSLGISYLKKYINKLKVNNLNFYILQLDIKKYFYNIDHEIVLNKLKKIINDIDVISVLEEILGTTNRLETNVRIKAEIQKEINRLKRSKNPHIASKVDELNSIPFYNLNKGIPIGNMTSQLIAVYYLNDLDHYIKEKLHIKYYIRYMDDLILLHEDKDYLKYCYGEIKKFISNEKLELNMKKTHIYSIKNGINFLGYRFVLNKNNKLIVIMNSETKKRISRRLRYFRHNDLKRYNSSLSSYQGYFNMCSCNMFITKNGFYMLGEKL